MGWYPCGCCCVERVLFWPDFGLLSSAAGYYESIGLPAHRQSDWTGNIHDYQLVFWNVPTADASWWPTIRDGAWVGRIVIMGAAEGFPDPSPITDYINSIEPYTTISVSYPVPGFSGVRRDAVPEVDTLTEGVTSISYHFPTITSGGTVLFRTQSFDGSRPFVAKHRDGIREYVVAGQELFGVHDPANSFFDNLWYVDHVPCGTHPMFTDPLNGGLQFSFTSGALVGTAAATSTSTIEFTLSGSLLDVDAGRMQGATTTTFTVTGAMTGAANALSGAAAGPTFTVTGSMAGSGAAVAGTTTLTFSTAGLLRGTGNLFADPTTCFLFTTEGRLTVFGAQSGVAVLTFTPSGVLTGTYPFLAGTTTLTFTASAAMRGAIGVSGTTTLTFTNTAALQASAQATGTTSLTFTTSATAAANAPATGTTSLTFSTTAALRGTGPLAGTTSLTFTMQAAGTLAGRLAGTTTLTFTTTAQLLATAPATGTTSLTFSASGALRGTRQITGTTTLTFTTAAIRSASGRLTGTSQLSFLLFSGALRGSGRMLGTTTLTFTPSAMHSAQIQTSGSCQLSFLLFSGQLRGTANASGNCQLSFLLFSGQLRGTGTLAGTTNLTFTTSAAGQVTSTSTGSTSLTFSTSGLLTGSRQLTGTTTLTFSTQGNLKGNGRLSGTTTLTFVATGNLTGEGSGFECNYCLEGTTPEFIPIRLTNIGNAGCTTCADIEGDYILEQVHESPYCFYQHIFQSSCGQVNITLSIVNNGINGGISVGNIPEAGFSKILSVPFDCGDLAELVVTPQSGLNCDWTATTSTANFTSALTGSTSLTFSTAGQASALCSACNNNNTPRYFEMELSGTISGSACCSTLFGTYIIEQVAGSACDYYYSETNSCGFTEIFLNLSTGITGALLINGVVEATFEANPSFPYNCFNNRSLSVAAEINTCNLGSMSCQIRGP